MQADARSGSGSGTHRKSIPTSLCLEPAHICLSPPATSVSLLISPYCLFVPSLPTILLSNYCIPSHLLALCRCPFGLSHYFSPGFSTTTSMCLCLSSDTASTQINYLKAHLILLHIYTPTHTHLQTHSVMDLLH